MDHRHPTGSRGQPRLEDDYKPYQPYQTYKPYDPYDPYEQYPTRGNFAPKLRSPAQSPPRHHESERYRRVPSPSYYSDEPTSTSRRYGHHGSRHDDERRGRSAGPDRQRRGPSPSPFSWDPEPLPRYPRPSRYDRNLRREMEPCERDTHFMEPYDQELCSQDPPPRHYAPDSREKSSRDQPHRSRPHTRASPPKLQSRGRGSRHIDNGDDDEYNATRRRRQRSQTGDRRNRAPSGPSPTRGGPPTQRGRDSTKRRTSMPASTKSCNQWWQNPLVQAGALTALTAGAQAAIKSRNDPSPWLGPKGAKIATTALGAALVDGFIGKKHPNSVRENIAKHGVSLASGIAASSARQHHH
ncbi:hypothetical protein EDB80DRAFT_691654 [Ilyonectria destructans]|nr:hypothetical protein EDB80DRAFT_691654 [Ilyonectria destructans]